MPPMIRWLSGLRGSSNPSSPSIPSTQNNGTYGSPQRMNEVSWTAAFASDPTQWERGFEVLWMKAEKFLDKIEMAAGYEVNINYDEMSQYLAQLHKMTELLMMEVNAQPEPSIGPILDRFFTQQILERTMDCVIQVPPSIKPFCQLALIRVYEVVVSESHTQNHCLLVHKPILIPLFRLFDWCRRSDISIVRRPHGDGPSMVDKHFVLLLNQICTKMAEDTTLLHFFFTCSQGAHQFVVFSLLVRFLYEQNDVGQLARDALLLILSVSSNNDSVAEFVAKKSDFCPVVATGLSGCFSQLDRVLGVDGYDRMIGDQSAEALADFHSSILFCNAVVQAAHPCVVEKIAQFFYSGFLISVVKPALLQEEREGMTAATAYLHVCLQTVTESSLVRTIVRLLLVEKDDEGHALINVIVKRIENGDRLSVVSLGLIDCLLQLGCEDILLVLCLRHLLPLRHTTRSSLSKSRDRASVVTVCERLLACVPECTLKFMDISSPLTLHLYLREGASMVERKANVCAQWKWRYDGVQPSPLLFRGDSDSEGNAPHSPFTRLSSCRSSMSSAAHGLNRYFTSRGAHLTSDSHTGLRLADLGAYSSPSHSPIRTRSPSLDGEGEFVLPPITSSSMMTSSMVDYFHLVAYDDLSDDPPSSPERVQTERRVEREAEKEKEIVKSTVNNGERSENESINGNGFDTDAEMARSFVLTGWADVEDLDTFLSLLDRRSVHSKKVTSLAENMSFIDSKIQYMRELAEEKEDERVPVEREEGEEETQRNGIDDPLRGQPIEEGTDTGLFLETLLTQIDQMCVHSLPFNLQLASVLSTLASYPQPILSSFLFGFDERDEKIPRLLTILESVKERLDAFAVTVEGIDVWIGRAMRQLNGKAERMERQNDFSRDSPREDSVSSLLRNRPGSGRRQQYYKYHSHKVVESRESVRTDEAIKNTVHAAIVLANLVQQLAAIALHQSVAVVTQSTQQNS